MLALLLLGLVAVAGAAPRFHHHHRPYRYSDFDSSFDDVFDTAGFWQRLETDMMEMEKMLNNFHAHFSLVAASAGVVGNEYKVTMSLTGFVDKDIVVKARDGVLMVQAVHKSEDGSERNYVDIRTLPSNVDTAGVWTYNDEVLTITFPIKSVPTEAPVTEDNVPAVSREEMGGEKSGDVEDADVGLNNQPTKEKEIKTNEIPSSNTGVEATTYAVDLKDQYEFVPVHYRK